MGSYTSIKPKERRLIAKRVLDGECIKGYAFGGLHQDTVWTYDNNTQTFTNPNTGAKVPIGSLGFKDPITANFEVGRLASIEGKNIDEWSAYGPSKSK